MSSDMRKPELTPDQMERGERQRSLPSSLNMREPQEAWVSLLHYRGELSRATVREELGGKPAWLLALLSALLSRILGQAIPLQNLNVLPICEVGVEKTVSVL